MLVYMLLIVGFALLIKGADFFVDGSSSVARILKVPPIIIGLTVVAFGTSMPEASVSVTASLAGNNDLAVSNVIGSNIFNLLVVLGASALLKPVQARWSVLKKEFPFSIFVTVVLLLLITGLRFVTVFQGDTTFVLSKASGMLLLLLFVLFVIVTVKSALSSRGKEDNSAGEEEDYKVLSRGKSAIFIIVGLAGIIWGGDLVVKSASQIASTFGLSQTFIGLTVVALGTSLPELVTSMVAAKKGENDLAVGNVIGSNIFNILLILGLSAAISPVTVGVVALYDMFALIIASGLVYVCAISQRGISRKEGVVLLATYIGYFIYIIVR